MLPFLEDWGPTHRRRERRQFNPRATTAKARMVRKDKRLRQPRYAHEREADAWFVVLAVTLLNLAFLPEVKGSERANLLPICDILSPIYVRGVADLVLTMIARMRQRRLRRDTQFRHLLVKEGREEQEITVLEPESLASFRDAPLSQDDALLAATERVTD
jgi:hypothetical protein